MGRNFENQNCDNVPTVSWGGSAGLKWENGGEDRHETLLGAFTVVGLGDGAVLVVGVGSGLGEGISIILSFNLLGLRELWLKRNKELILIHGLVFVSSNGGDRRGRGKICLETAIRFWLWVSSNYSLVIINSLLYISK